MSDSRRIDDEGIYAFNPPPRGGADAAADAGGAGGAGDAAAPGGRRASRRAWRWWLGGLAAFGVLLTLAAVLLAMFLVHEVWPALATGWSVVVDDVRLGAGGLGLEEADPARLLLVVAAVALAVVVALFVVSVVVPLAVGLGLLAALVGIGLALLAVLAVGALVLSPVWGVLLLLWLALRPRRAATTMGA